MSTSKSESATVDQYPHLLGIASFGGVGCPGAIPRARNFYLPPKPTLHIGQQDKDAIMSTESVNKGRSMELFNIEAAEKAEAQIDAFISKRSREREEANRIEAAWAETTRRYNQKRRRELREEWREYHLERAECLERTAAELAADHRARAAAFGEEEVNHGD